MAAAHPAPTFIVNLKGPTMKSFSLVSVACLVIAACRFALWPILAAVHVVEPLAIHILRRGAADLHALWQVIRAMPAAAYRTIGALKPVYRESYATNGHSLGVASLT